MKLPAGRLNQVVVSGSADLISSQIKTLNNETAQASGSLNGFLFFMTTAVDERQVLSRPVNTRRWDCWARTRAGQDGWRLPD